MAVQLLLKKHAQTEEDILSRVDLMAAVAAKADEFVQKEYFDGRNAALRRDRVITRYNNLAKPAKNRLGE